MQESLNRRLSFIGAILMILALLAIYRLVSLQFADDTGYFANVAWDEYSYKITVHPPRGEIYDRSGVLLATNSVKYEIGLSPVLIYDRQGTAEALSGAMGIPKEELLEDISSEAPYVMLASRASASMGQAVLALGLDGVAVSPITERFYPHGSLAAHVLGFVARDNVGYYGIEGFYNNVLSGDVSVSDQSRIPFEATGGEGWRQGSTLHLTLDSEIQYLAENTLAQAVHDTNAEGGTVIVLDPKTGEVLAMANLPTYDPNLFYSQAAEITKIFDNAAVSKQYEPGSVVKVLTMAIALENEVIRPDSTYEDTEVLEVGGISIYNWDRQAHGVTSMTDLLGLSLNVGAARLSIATGPLNFYDGLDAFGLGKLTDIDLQAEARGSVRRPGQADWYEADLATNAFGQGMAVTPIQIVAAISAVANDGLIMKPHMVTRREDADNTVTTFSPTALGRAISEQTAQELSAMLAEALTREASKALVPGYTVAGKTGTAEIPIPGGYDPEATITSFVGYGPVEDPQFVVLIKLDRPTTSRWGADTAAPAFSTLVRRLVILMEIPPNDVRVALEG
ncbi:MAG: penicillin-binding protein 2 [Anaerolineae bacterium]|nr:penicillin-binding protein 2 [Anaerolineae bacterium]